MNYVAQSIDTNKPVMSGKDLAETLKRMRPGARAVFALDLVNSDVPVSGLSREQVAGLTGVPVYNVAVAAAASETELEALRLGYITLADVREAHRRTPDWMRESQVMAIINYVGVERLWATYERVTAPPVTDTTTTTTINPMAELQVAAAAE